MTDRVQLGEALLQEAVFQSRAKQAAGVSLLRAERKDGSSPTNCGLGQDAHVELALSERGRELFDALWPEPPAAERLEAIGSALAEWVERQDRLDRDRNHFLKAFRHEHGFDRTRYSAEQTAAYEAGLERINDQCNAERRAAAERLV